MATTTSSLQIQISAVRHDADFGNDNYCLMLDSERGWSFWTDCRDARNNIPEQRLSGKAARRTLETAWTEQQVYGDTIEVRANGQRVARGKSHSRAANMIAEYLETGEAALLDILSDWLAERTNGKITL